MRKKTVSGLAAAVAVTTGLGLAMAAPASAKDAGRTGMCSDGSTWTLSAKANPSGDHDIEVKFRIRSDEGGQTWDWTLADRGTVVASGESTAEKNGKLDVQQDIPNLKGFDKIVLDATNTSTGETCHAHIIVKGD
jgi:hypothetical protein